jgi:hypothetical protein
MDPFSADLKFGHLITKTYPYKLEWSYTLSVLRGGSHEFLTLARGMHEARI